MKTTVFVLIAAFAASFALPQANAEVAIAKGTPTTYLVQVDGVTTAILPYNPKGTMDASCSGDASYNKETGVLTFADKVRLVVSVLGQDVVTITGEHVTLLPQK